MPRDCNNRESIGKIVIKLDSQSTCKKKRRIIIIKSVIRDHKDPKDLEV